MQELSRFRGIVGDVCLVRVANNPAGRGQQLVDLVARELFGRRQLSASADTDFRNIACPGRVFCRMHDSSGQKPGRGSPLRAFEP